MEKLIEGGRVDTMEIQMLLIRMLSIQTKLGKNQQEMIEIFSILKDKLITLAQNQVCLSEIQAKIMDVIETNQKEICEEMRSQKKKLDRIEKKADDLRGLMKKLVMLVE